MKPYQANELAKRLKGMLTRMTDTQVLWVASQLERFDLLASDRAANRYICENSEFDAPRFLAAIATELRNMPDPKRDDVKRVERDLAATNAQVDAVIAGMTDEAIAVQRDLVLKDVEPKVAEVLKRLQVRKCRTLKNLIALRVPQSQATVTFTA